MDGMGGPLEAVPLGDGNELAREEEERRSGRGCMMDLEKRICDRRGDLRIRSASAVGVSGQITSPISLAACSQIYTRRLGASARADRACPGHGRCRRPPAGGRRRRVRGRRRGCTCSDWACAGAR